MGFKYVFGATPTVESESFRLILKFSGWRPNRGSPLESGAAYPFVIFFDCEYFLDFLRIIFPFKYPNDCFECNYS